MKILNDLYRSEVIRSFYLRENYKPINRVSYVSIDFICKKVLLYNTVTINTMDSYIANEILKIEQYPDFFCWSVPSIQDDDPISILIKREIEHKGYNPDEFKWVI